MLRDHVPRWSAFASYANARGSSPLSAPTKVRPAVAPSRVIVKAFFRGFNSRGTIFQSEQLSFYSQELRDMPALLVLLGRPMASWMTERPPEDVPCSPIAPPDRRRSLRTAYYAEAACSSLHEERANRADGRRARSAACLKAMPQLFHRSRPCLAVCSTSS